MMKKTYDKETKNNKKKIQKRIIIAMITNPKIY